MSFFIKGKQVNGVKRTKYATDKNNKKRKLNTKAKNSKKNEEITSSEDEGLDADKTADTYSSEDENETAQEKKVRLAKLYLEEIEREERNRLEDKYVDDTVISRRLKEDYLKETGRLRLTVAEKYKSVDEEQIKILKSREQRNTITCLCLSSDDKYVFAGSKDGAVVKYSLTSYKKEGIIPFVKNLTSEKPLGHSSQILSIAISSDNKFLAVGTKSKEVFVWDPNSLKFIEKLLGHKSAITGLCFKKDSNTLYSSSEDRTLYIWNLDEMTYIDTLLGHEYIITSIDTLYKDRLVSSGGRDLRMWKIPEETQLIFNGHLGNIDNVRLVNEENFVSSSDDGQLCVWSMLRKKPLCVVENAHGIDLSNHQPYWVSALGALVNTDLLASGSQDGSVKLWKLENNFKTCKLIMEIPVEGFVNCLSFSSDGSFLIIAAGREHKLGRWTTVKSAKNRIIVVPFLKA
nr:U3 small nucleolar RNA-interacting protein 2 [Leptinotarsa decemlineata]